MYFLGRKRDTNPQVTIKETSREFEGGKTNGIPVVKVKKCLKQRWKL